MKKFDLDKTINNLKLKMKIKYINENISMFDIFDIFGVKYRDRVSQQMLCPLPDHHEKVPSAKVYSETDTFYCFGCYTYCTPVKMAKKLLESDSVVETIEFLEEKLNLKFDEEKFENIAKSISESETIAASKAYSKIESLISSLYSGEEAYIKYNRLDKVFLGIKSSHQLLKADYKTISNYVLA